MKKKSSDITRLSTVDAQGRRLWVYPSDVTGKYRIRRNWVSGFLVLFFLILPWFKINGHQALLLDVWNGRFSIFGIRFWSHDAPMLFFIFGGAAILLAFITLIWGRLWCGWACPQTVFVDSVFRKVERWIEGDSVMRRRLDAEPMSEGKFLKKTLKWLCFTFISLILSHSFLAYFVGTEKLAEMMGQSPFQSPGSFLFMVAFTALVLFDFGWLREQFCTLLCPYGRFQSVLMDDDSLAIVYDQARGEPRRGEQSSEKPAGDCISCQRCVHVCPTGIDIRNGLQLECIACTACIDACDTVMKKIKKPIGLIRYSSGSEKGKSSSIKLVGYLFILILFLIGLIWTLVQREPVQMTIIRSVGSPYEEVNRPSLEKEIVNHFKIDFINQSFESVQLNLTKELQSESNGLEFVSAQLPLEIAPGESRRIDLFVRFPISFISKGRGSAKIITTAHSKNWKEPITQNQEVPLVGPLR